MSFDREQARLDLIAYLRTIQKPSKLIESVGLNDGLVSSGLIDSLAIVQIVVFLETNYGINFAASGFDPDRLATIASILDLIEETRR